MRIPDVIKVGAQRIRIEWVDDLSDSDGEVCVGIARVGAGRIEISRCLNDEEMPECVVTDTFLHEVIHCISTNYGVDLTEQQVGGVAGGLLAVIRDNDLDFREGIAAKKKKPQKGSK